MGQRMSMFRLDQLIGWGQPVEMLRRLGGKVRGRVRQQGRREIAPMPRRLQRFGRTFAMTAAVLASGLFATVAAQANPPLYFGNGQQYAHGANMPWLDGAYDHDIGINPQHTSWGCAYNSAHVEAYFADMQKMNVRVVRWWLFENEQGLQFDGNGYVSGLDPTFVNNLDDIMRLAAKYHLAMYFTLGASWSPGMTAWPIITDAGGAHTQSWLNNAVLPIVNKYKGNQWIFGFDIYNEIDGAVAGSTGNWTSSGTDWGTAVKFVNAVATAIRNTDSSRHVSCSTGWHNDQAIKNGTFKGTSIDFYDYHNYNSDGSMDSAWSLGVDKPIIIGEFGNSTTDDNAQATTVKNILNNAANEGYSGAIVWAYEGPIGQDNFAIVRTDGSWRPAAYAVQAFNPPGGTATAPAAPTGLTASGGNQQVSLAWSASSGATSYNVYRGTSAGGEGSTPIATGLTGTSYTNSGLANGTTYYYKVAAVNGVGTSAMSNEANATANVVKSTPYTGTPASIPGTVLAENYDLGGEGVAYHDSDATNDGGAYRPNEGVDLEASKDTNNANDIGWTVTGEWVKYTVDVATAGTYAVSFRISAPSAVSDAFNLLDQNGNSLTGPVAVPSTGGWYNWQNVNVNVTLAAGTQTLEIFEDAGGWNINDLVFTSSGSGGGTNLSAPTGLSATAGNATVALSWTAASGATSYNVYGGTTAGGESATALATGVTSTSYTDNSVTNGTTYYYTVKAVNASQTSGASNEASATPQSSTTGGGGGSGSGPATISAVAGSSNTQWYGEDDFTISDSSPIASISLTVTVQKTSGLTYNGQYNTLGSNVAETHVDNGSTITYTFSVSGVSTTSVEFGSQYNLSGTTHSVTGDTYSVTYTTGGVSYTSSGVF